MNLFQGKNVTEEISYWKESWHMKNLSKSHEENKSAHSDVLGYLGFPNGFSV